MARLPVPAMVPPARLSTPLARTLLLPLSVSVFAVCDRVWAPDAAPREKVAAAALAVRVTV